jgi:hypothetical protein
MFGDMKKLSYICINLSRTIVFIFEYMVGLRKLQFRTLVLRSFNVLITNYLYTINLINFTRYSVLPNVITIRPYSQQSTGFFMSKF